MLKKVFCMRLHTAGRVIGWLGIIGSIMAYIEVIVLMRKIDIMGTNLTGGQLRTETNKYIIDNDADCILLAINSVYLVCSILLIVGTRKNRHKLLLPWIIIWGITLALAIFISIFRLCVVLSESDFESVTLIGSIPFTALAIYVHYGIISLYKHIQTNRGEEGFWQA
ncbi:uncharacterized protein LOC124459821 [Drosophila willistoni]|uniref:uncharacterized protein LOC124459821 n=1 Tax=Drosophila willistoni TaxID=7260 RepID=UPI001F0779A1|nr:uncharacterized protein LOC124459821 [Drosophila willistoni]